MWPRKLFAFIVRDFNIERSYRLAFILRYLGVFLSIATFFFIAKLFGKGASSYLKAYGGDYFSFVLIGIAFSGFLTTGLNSFSRSISSAQAQGTLEAMLVTPTSLASIILNSSLWNFLFTSFNVIVYLIIGSLVFGVNLTKANLGAALLIMVITIVVFSGIGIISASFIMVLKRGDPINWIFGSLSSLMGGTFFPITVMPAWLQKFSYLFPIFYSLRAMRQALLLGYSFADLSVDLIILGGMAVVIMPLSIIIFNYAVRQAKIDGTLVTY